MKCKEPSTPASCLLAQAQTQTLSACCLLSHMHPTMGRGGCGSIVACRSWAMGHRCTTTGLRTRLLHGVLQLRVLRRLPCCCLDPHPVMSRGWGHCNVERRPPGLQIRLPIQVDLARRGCSGARWGKDTAHKGGGMGGWQTAEACDAPCTCTQATHRAHDWQHTMPCARRGNTAKRAHKGNAPVCVCKCSSTPYACALR